MSKHNKLFVLLQYFFADVCFGPILDKNDLHRDADEIQHIKPPGTFSAPLGQCNTVPFKEMLLRWRDRNLNSNISV